MNRSKPWLVIQAIAYPVFYIAGLSGVGWLLGFLAKVHWLARVGVTGLEVFGGLWVLLVIVGTVVRSRAERAPPP